MKGMCAKEGFLRTGFNMEKKLEKKCFQLKEGLFYKGIYLAKGTRLQVITASFPLIYCEAYLPDKEVTLEVNIYRLQSLLETEAS